MKNLYFLVTVIFMFSACAPSQEEKRVAILKDEAKTQRILDSLLKVEEEKLEAERLAEIERNRLTVEKIDIKMSELQNVDFSNLNSVPSIVEAIEF